MDASNKSAPRSSLRAACRQPPHASRLIADRFFAFVAYGFVVAWYLRHGSPIADVANARAASPWYRQKRTVSFRDMICAFRAALCVSEFCGTRTASSLPKSHLAPLVTWLSTL